MSNFFFVVAIVITFVFYLFYKVQHVRSRRPVERKWLSAKSSIALGLFVGLFGINTLLIQQTTVAYIIAAVFILYGFASMVAGYKRYKHYLPFAQSEADEWDR